MQHPSAGAQRTGIVISPRDTEVQTSEKAQKNTTKPPDPENPNKIDEADIQAMMASFKDPNESASRLSHQL